MKSRKRANGRKVANNYDLDHLFREMTRTLIRDFQDNLCDPLFCTDVLSALNSGNPDAIRKSKPQLSYEDSVARFKAAYQVASLDKRYRYRNDTYTDQELQDMAIAKFEEVQSRLKALDWDGIIQDERMARILRGARALCHHVLGDYSDAELRQRARFGSGATVGVTAREANLAQRFVYPITGTNSQISWWKSEYDSCPHFQLWKSGVHSKLPYGGDDMYREVEYLKLTFVPKSHKALRAILANTTIGSYQSGGIGEMLRLRLRQKLRLDIKSAQHKHREISKFESIVLKHCTVDLQSASDSVSDTLVRLLLPEEWYNAINTGCCRKVKLPNGSIVEVETFSTMGIGCTFTLQTLIFYSLIWAVRAVDEILPQPKSLRCCKTMISVYGDDLIFGSNHYPGVVSVLERLGIQVNEEKSFVDLPFRESCGGDYYRGRDVRPFQPEVSVTSCSALEYEALLYKLINGLRQKWHEHEVRTTLHFLVSRVERVSAVKLVPTTSPEDSGVRIEASCTGGLITPDFLRGARCTKPKYVGHGLYRFPLLTKKSQKKEELRHGPYYWSSLRAEPLVSPYGPGQEYRDDGSTCPFPVTLGNLASLWAFSRFKTEGVELPSVLSSKTFEEHTNFGPYDNDLPYGPAPGDSPPSACNAKRSVVRDFVTVPHTAIYKRQQRTSEF